MNIDKLISRLTHHVEYCELVSDDWKDNVPIKDITDSITALQEQQAKIEEYDKALDEIIYFDAGVTQSPYVTEIKEIAERMRKMP